MDPLLLTLLVFIALVAVYGGAWAMMQRRVPGRAEEARGRSDWLTGVAWFAALGVALCERFVLAWLPFGGWLLAVGGALIVLGIGLRLVCRHTLGRYYLPQVKIQRGHRLVTSGPYHYVRHPMYLGSLLWSVGFTLALGTILGTAIMAASLLLALAYRIRVEEALLAAEFGGHPVHNARAARSDSVPSACRALMMRLISRIKALSPARPATTRGSGAKGGSSRRRSAWPLTRARAET